MQFGHDENKIRIKPTFSGQRATCPLCSGTIIGKCGDIYVKHWQHHLDIECDSWKEHETVWHRQWKAKFPDDWQEVIIKNNEETHIADIKTARGLVIEFQNSPISPATIEIRENFYVDMIWIVNAIKFKHNLKLKSAIESQQIYIEANASFDFTIKLNDYERGLKNLEYEIYETSKKLKEKKEKINFKELELENLKKEFNKTIIANSEEELKFKILMQEKSILNLYKEVGDISRQLRLLNNEFSIANETKEIYLKSVKTAIDRQKDEQLFKLSDMYYLDWKYERHSWKSADKKIYFDIGEDYLIEKINHIEFKKTNIAQFIDKQLLLNSSDQTQ
jgi:competence CoiA-like predicted nuclease